uniref:Ig-like domain-containing protein n=1 Tax=Denticeps clupeoides TaxID=299321 RepID=A0AAY4AE31_9TELE
MSNVLLLLLGMVFTVAGAEKSEVVVLEGTTAVLPCVLDPRSKQSGAIHWTKSRGRQKSGLMYLNVGLVQRVRCSRSELGDCSLHISRVTAEDAGEYKCTVQERGRVTTTDVTLRVIRVSFSTSEPLEGGFLNVSCSVTPWPENAKIKWLLNGKERQSAISGSRGRDTERRISSVSQSDAGNWTCVVLTPVNRSWKVLVEASELLKVKGIEMPQNDAMMVYAAVGSSADLPCVFTEGFSPYNTTWTRLSKGSSAGQIPSSHLVYVPLPTAPRNSSIPWDRSLNVPMVDIGDGGLYMCSARVQNQKMERKMELVTVQVSSKIKHNTLTLTCHLSNPKEVTKYEWVRVTYDIHGTASVRLVGAFRDLSLANPEEQDAGELACRYYGSRGLLGNVTYHSHTMGGLYREKGSSSNKGAMVVGFGILSLLVVLIALQMYRNHRRRKMIMPYPALETIVHSNANEQERNRAKQKKGSCDR